MLSCRLSIMEAALVEASEAAPAQERGRVLERFIDEVKSVGLDGSAEKILRAVEEAIEAKRQDKETIVECANRFKKIVDEKKGIRAVINRDVIGGLKVRQGHVITDASVSGALRQISKALA